LPPIGLGSGAVFGCAAAIREPGLGAAEGRPPLQRLRSAIVRCGRAQETLPEALAGAGRTLEGGPRVPGGHSRGIRGPLRRSAGSQGSSPGSQLADPRTRHLAARTGPFRTLRRRTHKLRISHCAESQSLHPSQDNGASADA
jgi:hypothetical protein